MRVVGTPGKDFDGVATVYFEVASTKESEAVTKNASNVSEVTFFHCDVGKIWTVNGSDESCKICAEVASGDVEV